MTTTPVMTITDEQIAEIERDIAAQAKIKHGQCEGGVTVRCGICRECGATAQDSCRRPLPKSYAIPSNITALISRLRAAEKDAERYRWLRYRNWWDSPLAVIAAPKESALIGSYLPTTDALDEAIDKAMEQSK